MAWANFVLSHSAYQSTSPKQQASHRVQRILSSSIQLLQVCQVLVGLWSATTLVHWQTEISSMLHAVDPNRWHHPSNHILWLHTNKMQYCLSAMVCFFSFLWHPNSIDYLFFPGKREGKQENVELVLHKLRKREKRELRADRPAFYHTWALKQFKYWRGSSEKTASSLPAVQTHQRHCIKNTDSRLGIELSW